MPPSSSSYIDLVGRSLPRRPDIWAARQRSPTNVEDVVKSAQERGSFSFGLLNLAPRASVAKIKP
jgi:hypothetical protein